MPLCKCISRGCGKTAEGVHLTNRQWQEHQRDDARRHVSLTSAAEDADQDDEEALVELEKQVFRSTLLGSNPLFGTASSVLDPPLEQTSPIRTRAPATNPDSLSDNSATYLRLRTLEQQVEEHTQKTVSSIADVTLGSGLTRIPELHPLRGQEEWFIATRKTLVPTLSSKTVLVHQYCQGLIDKVDEQLKSIAEHRDRWVEPTLTHVDTDRYINHPLQHSDSLFVASILLAVVLNILGQVSRKFANFALRSHKLLLEISFERFATGGKITPDQARFLKYHPKDIRTARKQFDLEPTLTIYAACPRCSCLYPPPSYPDFCTYNPAPDDPKSLPCGESLLLHGKGDPKPRRPFGYQDPKDWLARLLSRPGMEQLLDSSWKSQPKPRPTDIFDAELVRNFIGQDGELFRTCPGSEGRYIFSLSVDWYNPYTNKAAGLVASVGAISMVCLNLPPTLRYKWENTYLVGIIPGPGEPSLEETDHYLSPLIKSFNELWDPGVFFNRTGSHPRGRKVRCAILPFVTDMKASRKTVGSRRCQLCKTPAEKVGSGEELDPSLWDRHTPQEYLAIANTWKETETLSAREHIYRTLGIRWSPFLDLPYWNPVIFAIVDPMHCLFLGVIPTHFREIYRMDTNSATKIEKDAKKRRIVRSSISLLNEESLQKGQDILAQSEVSKPGLSRLPYATLDRLCQIYEVDRISKNKLGKITKATMTEDLYNWRKALHTFTPHSRAPTPSIEIDQELESPPNNIEELISGEDLLEIRRDIARTITPTWFTSLPTGFGSRGAGKMKADEWRAAATLHLPITLIRLWGAAGSSMGEYLANTMSLISAVILATTFETSPEHVAAYTTFMQEYQNGLKKLFPDRKLRDNHHVSLHVGELLLRFGPVHSWWTFPFERIIGRLERMNSNWKIGQMELTVMNAFCASTNLRALLSLSHNIPGVARCAEILQECFPDGLTEIVDAIRGKEDDDQTDEKKTARQNHLDPEIHAALARYLHYDDPESVNRSASSAKHIVHKKHKYAVAKATLGDSLVMFHPGPGQRPVPGQISRIFTHTRQSFASKTRKTTETFIAIRRYIPAAASTHDPYAYFPVLRAKLYLTELSNDVEVFRLSDIWCHFSICPYDEFHSVVVPLDRRENARDLD